MKTFRIRGRAYGVFSMIRALAAITLPPVEAADYNERRN